MIFEQINLTPSHKQVSSEEFYESLKNYDGELKLKKEIYDGGYLILGFYDIDDDLSDSLTCRFCYAPDQTDEYAHWKAKYLIRI